MRSLERGGGEKKATSLRAAFEQRRTEVRVLKGLLGWVSLWGMQVSLGALTQTMRSLAVCALPPRLLGTGAANSPARLLRVLGNDLSSQRGTFLIPAQLHKTAVRAAGRGPG